MITVLGLGGGGGLDLVPTLYPRVLVGKYTSVSISNLGVVSEIIYSKFLLDLSLFTFPFHLISMVLFDVNFRNKFATSPR